MSSIRRAQREGQDRIDTVFEGSSRTRNFVNRTETAAFSCRSDGTVLSWNAGAERIFGRKAEAAVHRRCYELLLRTDVFGNDFCSRHCAVRQMALRDRPILPCRMDARDVAGRCFGARTMVLVLRGDSGDPELVHLFDPLAPTVLPPAARERRNTAPKA